MARIPEGATLIDNPVSAAPGFTLGNVHVMAGVPRIFEAMVESVLPGLTGGAPLQSRALEIFRPEGDIAGPLGVWRRGIRGCRSAPTRSSATGRWAPTWCCAGRMWEVEAALAELRDGLCRMTPIGTRPSRRDRGHMAPAAAIPTGGAVDHPRGRGGGKRVSAATAADAGGDVGRSAPRRGGDARAGADPALHGARRGGGLDRLLAAHRYRVVDPVKAWHGPDRAAAVAGAPPARPSPYGSRWPSRRHVGAAGTSVPGAARRDGARRRAQDRDPRPRRSERRRDRLRRRS